LPVLNHSKIGWNEHLQTYDQSQDFVLLVPISDNYPPMRNGHLVNILHIWFMRICVCYTFNLTKMIVSVC